MPYIVLANRLSFQKTKADNPTIPDGPEALVSRGQQVPDYAPAFLIGALSSSGLIVWAEDRRPDLVPAEDLPPQVRTADMPPVLPSDPNGVPPTLADMLGGNAPEPDPVVIDVDPAKEPDPAPAPLAPMPKSTDSKETWEQYAASDPRLGTTLAEAESMNKTDLMARVKANHQAASN